MRISDWSSDVCSSDLKRAPGCEIEKPHRVTLERTQARLRHEKQGKDHREHREEDDRQDNVQDRYPGHRLLGDRVIGVARLNVRPGLRERVDRGRAGTAGHAIAGLRSEEHTSELQSLMRISYAVFCWKK